MTFLEQILSDLDIMNIPYEEHYDPDGMQMFQLYLREKKNPVLSFSKYNPNNALITISTNHPCPNLQDLNDKDRINLETKLTKLGSELILRYEITILNDNLFFITGIVLDKKIHDHETMKLGIMKLIETYDLVVNDAIAIINELYYT